MIRRLDLGWFVRPAAEAGGGEPRVEPVFGYVVRRPEGVLVFDTGIGEVDAETEAHYRPSRRALPEALAAAGVSVGEVSLVVNCHLHFDHCGGNALLAGAPVVVQRRELETARTVAGYTMPQLVDHPGARFEVLDGEAQVWPGVWVVPTPGHTAGHQSLVVSRADGSLVLAGQAVDFGSQFGSAWLARRARVEGAGAPLPSVPVWLERVLRFDPRRVVFAHDACVWEPGSAGWG